MSRIVTAAWLVTFLLVGQTTAADQLQREDTGKSMAQQPEKKKDEGGEEESFRRG